MFLIKSLKILVKKGPSQEFLSFSAFWKKRERNKISEKSLLKNSCEIFFLKNGRQIGRQKWIPRISLFFNILEKKREKQYFLKIFVKKFL